MQNSLPTTWDDLRLLLALHRRGSLLAAGAALGVSTSTVARRVDALESALGRPLVRRSSAGTTLEPGALPLIALAEQVELALGSFQRADPPGAAPDGIAGTVRVSLGEGFVKLVTQVLSQLRQRHPLLHTETVVETRFADVGRREVDVALRVGRSTSAVVVEKRVGLLSFGLYAAPDYVAQRLGAPHLRAADFAAQDFVGLDSAPGQPQEPNAWLAARGATRFVFRSNSDLARQLATEQGQGICLLPDALARGAPGLLRLNVDAEPPSAPVTLAFHEDRRASPAVRAVIDALSAALATGLGPVVE